MKISFSHAKGAGKCSFCPLPISVGDVVVVGRSPVTVGDKFFYSRRRWHPQCYIDQGLQWLESHPVETAPKGRPKSTTTLTTDDKLKRLSLLRRHATTAQRMRAEMSKDLPNYEVLARLSERLEKLKAEVVEVGGVPKSWLPKIEEELPVDTDPITTTDSTEYTSCC